MSVPLLVAIVGPTASGKTEVSLRIAGNSPATIISADSRQVYRHLDIGTAKPTSEQLAEVPHRFINILEPTEEYSAGQFESEALPEAEMISASGRLPLVVGGSGLYVRALLRGISAGPGKDEDIRRELEERLEEDGEDPLRSELGTVDPDAAASIQKGKPRRLIRALEVYYLTGRPISAHHSVKPMARPFRHVTYGLNVPRGELYNRINVRAARMIEKGLLNEVRALLDSGVSPAAQSLNSVGYKESIRMFNGELSASGLAPMIARNTRRFAKRQLTWFRKEQDIVWIDASDARSPAEIADEILERMEALDKK